MNVVSAAQMREIDRVAIEQRGIPGIDLMEAAGRAVAQACIDTLPEPGPVVVLCGRGNNGGDGFVAARWLARSGCDVHVVPALGLDGLRGDAQLALERLQCEAVRFHELSGREALAALLQDADAAIDALLGTGATGELRPPVDWIVDELNASRIPVIAADLPTGLDADTGAGERVVRAAVTVAIGLPKFGMLSPRGVDCCGAVRVERIGFPADLLDDAAHPSRTLTLREAAAMLPARPRDAHKGTFGTAAILAGSRDMPGAAVLCGIGALRSGAGLVRVATVASNRALVATQLPEVLLSALPEDESGAIAAGAAHALEEALGEADAAVAGPGCSTHAGFQATLAALLQRSSATAVLDADALNVLARRPEFRLSLSPSTILTPHPAELGRLLGRSVADIQGDRWSAAREASKVLGCIVVLKGFGTLVAEPGGRVAHVPSGNTALARGGSGDVLAGMIGGLRAQGVDAERAAVLGAFVCGLAADIAVRERSARGLTTREIAECLPLAWREIERAAT